LDIFDGPPISRGKVTRVKNLQVLRKKEVLALCAMIFTADVYSGITFPTFSLYAQSLGASLALIGALSGVAGLTRIFSAVPVGMISDSKGRKNVLSAGMLLSALSAFLYTVAPNPYFLFPIRVLGSLAGVSVFFIGVAYLGDIVAKQERGLAIGLYTTCMGLGFAVGPFIGGRVAEAYGYRASYQVATFFALLGFAIARLGLVKKPPDRGGVTHLSDVSLYRKLNLMVREPDLLAASLANLLTSVVFGAIMSFFPLYVASLSVGDAAIGSMFAVRALCSASARLPTGLLTTRFSNRIIMLISLALMMVVAFAISCITVPVALGIFLAGEGVAYGVFLTSGQAFVTERSTESDRGTALGVYSTAGSLGSAVAPFILGFIADLWGLAAVFGVTGGLVLVGIGALEYMSLRQRRALALRMDAERHIV